MNAKTRKSYPLYTGFLKYFPDAIMEVAHLSKVGNDQHNPGMPLLWDRAKSQDEPDALMRHLKDAGTRDTDGERHTTKVAWRALAMLQKEIEAERNAESLDDAARWENDFHEQIKANRYRHALPPPGFPKAPLPKANDVLAENVRKINAIVDGRVVKSNYASLAEATAQEVVEGRGRKLPPIAEGVVGGTLLPQNEPPEMVGSVAPFIPLAFAVHPPEDYGCAEEDDYEETDAEGYKQMPTPDPEVWDPGDEPVMVRKVSEDVGKYWPWEFT